MRFITFSSLQINLMDGREIEFRYGDKEYSITNSHYEWHFCCDTDGTTIILCAFPEFDVLVTKVKNIRIDEVSIERIFNEHLGGLDILAIL